jgi:hypothetical protein
LPFLAGALLAAFAATIVILAAGVVLIVLVA